MYYAILSVILSAMLHFMSLFFIGSRKILVEKDRKIAKIVIQEKPQPQMEIKKEPKKPEEPKKKEEPKKTPLANKTKKELIKKEAKPVQGVTKESVVESTDPSAIAVPLGNTLYTKDEGIRTSNPEGLDLSARAVRIGIKTPALTEEAIENGVEGKFVVEVYIDEKGVVTKAELNKKIGYGMDQLLIKAALEASFIPRKDASGRSISGWDQLTFVLVVPS